MYLANVELELIWQWLGPLSFLLYTNDLSNLTTDGCVLNMYTDDVIIHTSAATSDDLQLKL